MAETGSQPLGKSRKRGMSGLEVIVALLIVSSVLKKRAAKRAEASRIFEPDVYKKKIENVNDAAKKVNSRLDKKISESGKLGKMRYNRIKKKYNKFVDIVNRISKSQLDLADKYRKSSGNGTMKERAKIKDKFSRVTLQEWKLASKLDKLANKHAAY